MGTNKRLEDLTAYKGVLPYASELFGVYQPLIGWKSKRTQQWLSNNNGGPGSELLSRLIPLFETRDKIEFNADCNINLDLLNLAELRRPKLLPQRGIVLQSIREKIQMLWTVKILALGQLQIVAKSTIPAWLRRKQRRLAAATTPRLAFTSTSQKIV